MESAGIEVNAVEFRHESSIEEMAQTAAAQIPAGQSAAVAGFSMGGMVAIMLASLYPEKVNRLALLNSNVPVSYTHLRAHETNESISYAVFC